MVLTQANPADLIKQAEADFINGKFSEAITNCEEAVLVKPDAVTYQIMGKARVKINQVDEAIAAYQKALKVKPDLAEVYVSLGSLHFQQQQPEAAIAAYQKAIEIAADLKDAYRSLVQVWLDLGKVDEGEELSYNALIQHPSWATPQEFCTLGRGLVEEGKVKQGITCFQQAIELDSKLSEAYYSLGEIFDSQQKWDEAVKNYRQVVELNSESQQSYYGLKKALAEKQEWLETIDCYRQVIKLEASISQESSPESEENIDHIGMAEVYHLLGNALQ